MKSNKDLKLTNNSTFKFQDMEYAPRQIPVFQTELKNQKSSNKTKLKVFPKIIKLTIGIFLITICGLIGQLVWLQNNLKHTVVFGGLDPEISVSNGINWLIVGSDAREGLSLATRKELNLGYVTGGRADTIMMLHFSKNSKATLVSIPRDLLVNVPGYGLNKINAAFSLGGPHLLIKTLQQKTAVRFQHYLEVGFSEFASLINVLGGIEVCVPYDIDNSLADIKITKGCQNLTGDKALGLVRSRETPRADLDRVVNQRLVVQALFTKLTGISTLINPIRLSQLVLNTPNYFKLAESDNLKDLLILLWNLRYKFESTTVPIGDSKYTDVGVALEWTDRTTDYLEKIANS